MAHLIEGVTTCAICGLPIDGDAFLTPPFLTRKHRLWRYSDAAFHRQCLLQWGERPLLEDLLERYLKVRERMPASLKQYDEIDRYLNEAYEEFDRYALEHQ